MRIADRIAELAEKPVAPFDADWPMWMAKLNGAAFFEVAAGAGQLSHGTTNANPALAAARTRQAIRLPAPTCWFEWAGASAEMGPSSHEPPRKGTTTPDRCGVLVETARDNPQRGAMSWVWSFGAQLQPSIVSVVFDWGAVPAEVPCLVRSIFAMSGASWPEHVREMHGQSRYAHAEFEPFLVEEARYGHLPCSLTPTSWAALKSLFEINRSRAQAIFADALRDLQHEPIFVLGIAICLCTPGILEISEPLDMARLNKARREQGRTKLFPFRWITASEQNVIQVSDRVSAAAVTRGFHAA